MIFKLTDAHGERSETGYYLCAAIAFILHIAAVSYIIYLMADMAKAEGLPPFLFLFGSPIQTVLGILVILLPALIGIVNLIYGIRLTGKRLRESAFTDEKSGVTL